MLKKNVPAFSTEQNAAVVIQSVPSKFGMLAARLAQTDQWSDIGVGCHENENEDEDEDEDENEDEDEDEDENENEDLSFVFVRKRTTRSFFVLRKRRPCVSKKNYLPLTENFPAEKAYRLLESILATKYSRHELFIARAQE